jgi:hypothetical protein
MVDLWSRYPIQKLWQIIKSMSMQNFTFFEVPKYFSNFYSCLLIHSIGKGFKLEKSLWAVFLRSRPSSALPQPNPAGEAGPRRLLPRDAAKRAPAPHGPHLSASLLHGRETAMHPTRYRACYRSNPPPSSAVTPSVVASQIPIDGPSTHHLPMPQGRPRVRLPP